MEPIEAKEPTESTEANEPTDPIDRTEPTDPIERMDPFEAIDRIERSDRTDQRVFVEPIEPSASNVRGRAAVLCRHQRTDPIFLEQVQHGRDYAS